LELTASLQQAAVDRQARLLDDELRRVPHVWVPARR
jgi:hypothetical protein